MFSHHYLVKIHISRCLLILSIFNWQVENRGIPMEMKICAISETARENFDHFPVNISREFRDVYSNPRKVAMVQNEDLLFFIITIIIIMIIYLAR